MSRSRRNLLLPALALFAALLLAAPASAVPAFGWERFFEPLFRLGHLFASEGWAIDPNGFKSPAPAAGANPTGLFASEGWAIDPNGRVAPPLSNQGWDLDPNG